MPWQSVTAIFHSVLLTERCRTLLGGSDLRCLARLCSKGLRCSMDREITGLPAMSMLDLVPDPLNESCRKHNTTAESHTMKGSPIKGSSRQSYITYMTCRYILHAYKQINIYIVYIIL